MNRHLRYLVVVLLVLYTALFVRLNQIQVFQAEELNAHDGNNRAAERDYNRARGTISTIDGQLVARSVQTSGRFEFQREYPEGELYAHVAGYISFEFGADGVEKVYNDELAGQTFDFEFDNFSDLFVNDDDVGDVTLTLDHDVQEVAREQLGDRLGSVVALDPETGGIIAFWSNPSFDPNLLATNDLEAAEAARTLYLAFPTKPLLHKMYQEVYFPGSTFKVVTSAAGLDSGLVTEDEPAYPVATEYTPPLTTQSISNFGGSSCGGTLFEILAASCNSAFAEMGAMTLGPNIMVEGAEGFGFNDSPPIDLPSPAESIFPTDYGEALDPPDSDEPGTIYENTPALAQASIGQYEVAATPLQMALVAAGVANDGVVMRPHVMHDIRDSNGNVVEEYDEGEWLEAMDSASASTLRQAMIGVVESGTANAMAIPGYEVGGKTGTAQLGTEPPTSHAWIIGFAGPEGGEPEVVVAVLVQAQEGASEQTGGQVAAPIARAVLEEALGA
ncbi:MAG: Penicillin-binding protein A [Acidimicrobiales bacterium]|nr:MAG: penicillin-binding protein 2 [Actinomycetota bacterium]MBV6508078.1 Penicillin-binding protein A [Acidimicrobiales bacterium]RIK05297.1 MAG: cell division protein FtsI [Acidobacteriota bacterium]